MRVQLYTGYDIIADLPHGFNLLLGRLIVSFHFDWPRPVWYNKFYALNEHGYVQGMPVRRAKPKRWRLRGIQFPMKYRVVWK